MTDAKSIDDYQLGEWLKRDDSETLNRIRLHALVAEVRRLRGLIKWAEATPYRKPGCCLWSGHDVNGEYRNNHRGDCMAFDRDGTPR